MQYSIISTITLKWRILHAIKNGNHEEKYITEAVLPQIDHMHIQTLWNFHAALQELKAKGEIKYIDYLDGYYNKGQYQALTTK